MQLTAEQIQKVMNYNTRITDGLFTFVNQGQFIVEMTNYDDNETNAFIVEILKNKEDIAGIHNASYVEDVCFDDYTIIERYAFTSYAEALTCYIEKFKALETAIRSNCDLEV